MKIYKKSTRNGETNYTCFDGMTDSEIETLMQAIGHTNIQDSTESEFEANKSPIE